MEGHIKAKVTSSAYPRSRPGSPTKNYGTSLSPPPILRPKAKVNSSATPQPRRPSASNIRATVSASATVTSPRAPSPFKPTQSRAERNDLSSSPALSQFKAKVVTSSPRPRSVIGGGTSPESRQRALTSATGRSEPPTSRRPRRGSASSTLTAPLAPSIHRGHVSSPSSSSKLNPSASPNENGSPSSSSTPGTSAKSLIRVKSKISSLADSRPHSPSSLPPSPLLPSRPLASHINRTARVPSISNIKVTPPLAPSPVVNSPPGSGPTSPTSPTSSVSGQRYATTRETHSSKPHIFQSFQANDDNAVSYSAYTAPPRKGSVIVVDPASVPLPPQSPPTSTLSFSSRSSASRSSVSYETQNSSEASRSTAPTLHSRVNGVNGHISRVEDRLSPPRTGVEGLGIKIMQAMADETFEDDYAPERMSRRESSANEDDDGDLLDKKKRAQAKSNRKIEDLEITNRSLLAINSSLEATKHRQAKEIRDLRRKLRESRLILPPRAYREVKSSDPIPPDEDDEDEDDEEDSEGEEQAVIAGKTDEAYRRVKGLLEKLLEEGQRALEATPEDLAPGGKSGAKVLSEEEARTWRGDDMDSHSALSREDGDALRLSIGGERPLTPSRIAVPDDDDGLDWAHSEDEVEASLLDIDDIPHATAPPNITVTFSPP
ncbi:hypothetical protein EIP91_002689 [Steccherinum ochraceum]|uniref:Uncharacterized protein n=1 Tax=Steccherinum ochraceum TaxID=92696 RepID=A0A4R0RFD1_9APHY|nr:hypothetical protein EIP91_002689 [Steccherinum ochraceum]